MRRLRVDWRVFAVAIVGAVFFATPNAAGAQTAPRLCDGVEVTILGTAGDDVIRGTDGPDVIAGLQGDDVIEGMGGDDIICAGLGDDVIFGDGGFDIIFGAQGDDVIYAASGIRSDNSGFGFDELRLDERGARMFGGAGNDVIHGSDRWDRMQGGEGQDQLYGYEGRDWMRGGAGTDLVDGGIGIDDLHGGNGADVIRITSSDVVRGGAGLDRCLVNGTGHQLRSCEPNATVAIPLSTGRHSGIALTTTECRSSVPGAPSLQLGEGIIRSDADEIVRLVVDIAAFDAAGREVVSTGLSIDQIEPATSRDLTLRAGGDRAIGNPPFEIATCVVSVIEVSTTLRFIVPGDQFNVEINCEVTQQISDGRTVNVVSGSITNTTDEPRQLRISVDGFDENGHAFVFADFAVMDGADIDPGQTVEFAATASLRDDLPASFSRCSSWVS